MQIPLEEVVKTGDFGFPSTAAEVGTAFKANPDTQADTNRKAVEQVITGTDSQQLALAARRARDFVPLGGALNPFAAAESAPVVPFLPRAGTPLAVETPHVASRVLTATRAALELRQRMGEAWRPDYFAWLEKRYPDGIGEDQLERLAAQWSGEEGRDVKVG